jgi:hypothetical protein
MLVVRQHAVGFYATVDGVLVPGVRERAFFVCEDYGMQAVEDAVENPNFMSDGIGIGPETEQAEG